MTKMSLYAFFATFALGMAAMVFSRNVFLGSEPAVAAPSAVSGISGADAGVGMDAFASGNPLKLPDSAEAEYGGKGGWEYSGTVNANFVSARAQLDSWMQNQGWIPDKKITHDENIEPGII